MCLADLYDFPRHEHQAVAVWDRITVMNLNVREILHEAEALSMPATALDPLPVSHPLEHAVAGALSMEVPA